MKKWIVLAAGVACACQLAACGTPAGDASSSDPSDLGETGTAAGAAQEKEQESALQAEEDAARIAAYRTALEGMYYDHVYPDGAECDYRGGEPEGEFAVYDIDNDGRRELIVHYEGPSTAGKTADIYDYSDQEDALYREFSAYPLLTFYDNGMIRALWSHNQGVAGENFWPYDLYRYDAETDSYQIAGMVDAWDCNFARNSQGETFPEDVDADGDGMVYYVMTGENYDYGSPIDGPAYEQWLDSCIGGAQEVEVPFTALTEETIAALL